MAGAVRGRGGVVGDEGELQWEIGRDVFIVGLSEGPQVERERDHGDAVLVAGVLGMWSVGWMERRWRLGVGGWRGLRPSRFWLLYGPIGRRGDR